VGAFIIPYLPKSETVILTETYSAEMPGIIQTTVETTRSGDISYCGTWCPHVTESSVFLREYGVLALDFTVLNPTTAPVRDLVLRFNFWTPYSCSYCVPDYTSRLRIDLIEAGSTRHIHVELTDRAFRFGYSLRFRYAFEVESYVSQSLQWVSTTTLMYAIRERTETKNYLASLGDLIFPMEVPMRTIILATITMVVLLLTHNLVIRRDESRIIHHKLGGIVGVSEQSIKTGISSTLAKGAVSLDAPSALDRALDPEFMKYRDYIQEQLVSGRIDEKEYVRLLREFLGKKSST